MTATVLQFPPETGTYDDLTSEPRIWPVLALAFILGAGIGVGLVAWRVAR